MPRKLTTPEMIAIIRIELKRIEAEQPKDGWNCWQCKRPNYYSDAKTQVERHETCIYICKYCKVEELPF